MSRFSLFVELRSVSEVGGNVPRSMKYLEIKMLKNNAPLAMLFSIILCVSVYVGWTEKRGPFDGESEERHSISPESMSAPGSTRLISEYGGSRDDETTFDYSIVDIPVPLLPDRVGGIEGDISTLYSTVYFFDFLPGLHQFGETVKTTVKLNEAALDGVYASD